MSVYVINNAIFDDKNNSISIVDKLTVSIIIINSTFKNTKQLTLAKDLMFLSSIVFDTCKFETNYLYHSCIDCPSLCRIILKNSDKPNIVNMNYYTITSTSFNKMHHQLQVINQIT